MRRSSALTLVIPSALQALSNGALTSRVSGGMDRDIVRFAETKPLSTYLFTLAAGALEVESAVRNGRTLTMYRRETNPEKLQRNRDAIFDLHATALAWLE